MSAIFKRELVSYFRSPIGYAYLAVFTLLSGFYWFAGSLLYGTTDMGTLFSSLFTISAFLAPILTMRLFSEERRMRTDQLLLTAPVGLWGVVLGKYLAALLVYGLGISIILVYGLVMIPFGAVDWPVVLGGTLGLILLGAALISIGMFLSVLTENQVVAAVGGFAVALLLMLLDSFGSVLNNQTAVDLVNSLSFFYRYRDFTLGMVDVTAVVFFVTVSAGFCFLTGRYLESRRWN